MIFLLSWLINKNHLRWNLTENGSNGNGGNSINKRPLNKPNRNSRAIWIAILIATVPAVFAATSVGIAFGLSQNTPNIADICAQNNSTAKTSAPATVAKTTITAPSTEAGAQCNLVFNGFGSLWHYNGGKYPVGLRIDSNQTAIQTFGQPEANNAVIDASSYGQGTVISATNQVGGPAFFFNGGGVIEGTNDKNATLEVSNAGKNAALHVDGPASVVISRPDEMGVIGNNQANSYHAVGVQGTAAYGWGIQGDSHYGVGVYAATYNNNAPALFAANGGDGAVGYEYKGGGPTFDFEGDGKIKGNVNIQGNLTVSSLAINDDNEPLSQGDLVVISGEVDNNGNVPILKVKKARSAGDPNVIGVVDRPYNAPTAVPKDYNDPNEKDPIQPGGKFLVATVGAYKVLKVDASNGPILLGSLLVSSGANAGYAAKAKLIEVNGQQLAPLGVIGKALAPLNGDKGTIAVLLTQH